MSVTASQVNELRQMTGAGLMDCKKALEESGGDQDAAVKWLREKGIAKAAKKADRATAEGRIFLAGDSKKMVAVKFVCETDFVAKNEEFQKVGQELADGVLGGGEIDQEKVTALIAKIGENMSAEKATEVEAPENGVVSGYLHSNGKLAVLIALSGSQDETLAKDMAMQAAAMNPSVINPEDVDDAEVAGEKELWEKELEGKPEEMKEQIMKGKEQKWRAEQSLVGQAFVKDSGKKVKDVLGGAEVIKMERVELKGEEENC